MSNTLKNIVIALGAGGMLLIGTGLQQTLRLVDISSQLARVAEARLLVATGHVYLEEILSGDAALTPAIVQDYFSDADLELTAAATTGSSLQREWQALARSGQEVAQLASARMAGAGEGAGAGTTLDQQFDARFDAFMSEASTLQTTLSAQMQRATTLLRWQTAALMAILTGFLLLLFRLMRQTRQAAEDMVASARIQEKNTELLAHREQLERANREQNALLALSEKCQQADTVEALSAIVTRELSTHCNAFAAVAWLLPASRNDTGTGTGGRAVASLMVQPSRLPSQPNGVVLQAARNRLAIAFEVVPTYYRIDDALVTGLSPSAVHVLPVTCLDRVVAVFEFAFVQPPSAATLHFLDSALKSLALRYYLFGQDTAA